MKGLRSGTRKTVRIAKGCLFGWNTWHLSQEGVAILRQAVWRKWHLIENQWPECTSLRVRFSRYGNLRRFHFFLDSVFGHLRTRRMDLDAPGRRIKRALVREIHLSLPALRRIKDGYLVFETGSLGTNDHVCVVDKPTDSHQLYLAHCARRRFLRRKKS